MKKVIILLLLCLYPLSIFAAIDETKTDVYFANGILTKKHEAIANMRLIRKNIKNNFYNRSAVKMKKELNFDTAYNETHGQKWDLLESMMQKFDWVGLTDMFSSHGADLRTQINKYKASIESGHKVLVVAHSQGNLYTREAYEALGEESKDGWMQNYFEAISVASPMSANIKPHTPGIDWDNDVVPRIATLGAELSSMTSCDVRKVEWEFYDGEPRVKRPDHNYIYKNQVAEIYKNSWKGIEDGLDSNVHSFAFYMGEALKEGDKEKSNYGKEYINPFDDKKLTNSIAKDLIMAEIGTKLDTLKEKSSQWAIDEKSEEGTKDYRITVKHLFDSTNITMGKNVYPFDTSKYLYQVQDPLYPEDKEKKIYVKASFGGEKILDADYDDWDNKKENDFYYLQGTGEIISVSCNLEIVGSPNPKIHPNYGLWFDLPSSGSYTDGHVKYPFTGEKLTHFKCKLTGFYNTPDASGCIGVYIRYLDGSTHQLTRIWDWIYPNQGQVISVNDTYIEGTYNTYYSFGKYWDQGPMKDFVNYQIDVAIPIDKQDGIDYIYIQAGKHHADEHSVHYVKDIELTIDDKEIKLNPSCLF